MTAAGFRRPGLKCIQCGSEFALFLAVRGLVKVEDLPDPFLAECPQCGHKATYPHAAIGILVAVGPP
jgi:DNA-directed RNA polymerase subunit RPC12/RpoP